MFLKKNKLLSLQKAIELAPILLIQRSSSWSIFELCKAWSYSRQAYYQALKRQRLWSLQEDIILELVREKKRWLPNSGGLKMLHLIRPDLTKMSIEIGRDKFFNLLKVNDLLVFRKKRTTITTNSNHPFKKYGNLMKGIKVSRVYQVLVADITYIRTLEGFLYLALITDAFSRKIVGWDLSDSLELEGCLRALKKALRPLPIPISNPSKTRKTDKVKKEKLMIHHSDRGSQYCSYEYIKLLNKYHFKVSMAAAGNCYENAMAERVNGILKTEFELHQNFKSKNVAQKVVQQSIKLYNTMRPHRAIQLSTPQEFFDSNFNEHFVASQL
ncbi:IS3 family transposase [Bacillus mycoides]|uniref:IS3 family transposase n=1 Tax=Bacillus mycoides TaxID=1405 RepID=UPI003D64C219